MHLISSPVLERLPVIQTIHYQAACYSKKQFMFVKDTLNT